MLNDTTAAPRRKGVTAATLADMKRSSKRLSYMLYLDALYGDNLRYDTSLSGAIRVSQCATVWSGLRCPSCGQLHSLVTWGCHHRLCPLCSLRSSRATARQAQTVMQIIDGMRMRHSTVLLTLTQRNVPGAELGDELDRIIAAWSQLRYVRDVRRFLLGWARSIEITVGADGSFHPHLHAILILDRSAPPEMATDAYWRSLWRTRMDLDYIPICDCRPVTGISAVYEVSKYVTKVGKLLSDPSDAVTFDAVHFMVEAIYGRRLRSYGGLWAEIRRDLAIKDADQLSDVELAEADTAPNTCACGTPRIAYEEITLIWAGMDYRIVARPDEILAAE